MRVNWRAIWLVCWALFLITDQFLDLRSGISSLIAGAERDQPGLFHRRLQTGLLVGFVLAALAPLAVPLLRRWFLVKRSAGPGPAHRDSRDLSIAEALSYLARESAWGVARDGDELDVMKGAVEVVEDAARKGRLVVRGVPAGGESFEPVGGDYWRSAGIDFAATVDPSGTGGQTAPRVRLRNHRIPVFESLVVDRRDVMTLWPPDNAWRRAGRATVRGLARGVRVGRPKGKD